MKYNDKIIKKEVLIYIFIALITFGKGIGLSASNKIYIALFFVGFVLATVKILMEKYSRNEIIVLGSIIGIGILDAIIGKNMTILFTAVIIACLKNIDLKKIIKIMFITRLITFIAMIILPTIGIISNNIIPFYRDGQIINRYAFGFEHPNLAHSSFALILILWGYIYFEKINLFKIVGCEICNFLLYNFTYSRTGFLIVTIYLIFIYVMKKSNKLMHILPKLLNITLVICIIISFALAIGYSKIDFITKMDRLFTGRIKYMNMLWRNYSIPIIGQEIYPHILIDNGYFSLIYQGGLLAFIWYIYIAFKTNKYIVANKKNTEMIIIITLYIYCIFESYYTNILMNPSLVFFAYYIFKDKKELNSIILLNKEVNNG